MGQKRKIIAFVSILLGVTSLLRTVILLWNSYLPDFSVLYDSAFSLLLHNNPYTNSKLYTQVNYPPIAILLFFPFLSFSFQDASRVWLVLSIIFFLGSLYILHKISPLNLFYFCVTLLFSIISFPFKFNLGMGQVNIFLLFLLVSLLYFLKQSKSHVFAIILSLAISLKLFPAFFLIFLKRNYRNIFFAGIMTLILFFIPFLIFNKDISFYYFSKILFPLLKEPADGVYYNQSITGFFYRIGMPTSLGLLLRISFLGITFINLFKNEKQIFLSFSFLLTTILLINNFTWQHHLVLLLIPFYYLISQKNSKKFILVTLISYILIAVNIKNSENFRPMWYGSLILSHGFWGTFILWVLLLLKIKIYAKK